jgi:hypothetical protein
MPFDPAKFAAPPIPGVFAEFERAMIAERVRAGLRRAHYFVGVGDLQRYAGRADGLK